MTSTEFILPLQHRLVVIIAIVHLHCGSNISVIMFCEPIVSYYGDVNLFVIDQGARKLYLL